MTDNDSNGDHFDGDDDLKAAEQALADARRMPNGPERIRALKQAGQMRYDAEERRRGKGGATRESDPGKRRNPSDSNEA